MKILHDLMRHVKTSGRLHRNRTGIDTLRVSGAMLKFDLREGFPAVTTKRLAFKTVVGELIGFLRGYQSAADFRALNCNIWDQNANENTAWLKNPNRRGNDDLGRIYGVQWRNWAVGDYSLDQIHEALEALEADPDSRRIIVNSWNAGELDEMALPPCHLMFQLIADKDTKMLDMCMYQRSCDIFLGLPFNIASYAILLSLFAKIAGYQARSLVMFIGDAHIYTNHLEQVDLQLSREPYPLPSLEITLPFSPDEGPWINIIDSLEPSDFELVNYSSHPTIKGDMAV